MTGARFRRGTIALAVLLALATLAIACGPGGSTAQVDQNGIPCEHWCGNGSASVTTSNATTLIVGGGCYDQGSAGVDVRFGDWQGLMGVSDYLTLIAFRQGGPTPTPAPTPTPSPTPTPRPTANPSASTGAASASGASASPTADSTEYPGDSVSGSVDGSPFVLGTDTVVTLSADGKGTFSGTDDNGAGLVSGTFTCK